LKEIAVAVIGNGASVVQCVDALQPDPFQRTLRLLSLVDLILPTSGWKSADVHAQSDVAASTCDVRRLDSRQLFVKIQLG
jgi:hypothetical protein